MSKVPDYPEGFLRSIAQEVDGPDGTKKLVAAVPRYEVGAGEKNWTMPVSKLEAFLNERTLQGGRLISIVGQGSGLAAPVFLFTDEFELPPEKELAPIADPSPVDDNDEARKAWEAGE